MSATINVTRPTAGETAVEHSRAPGVRALATWKIRRLAAHIDGNLDHRITVDELARLAKMSGGHFTRAFTVSVGITPHAYVVAQRTVRAQQLLLQTEDSISQIALACGMADQSHLTRVFRRLVGTTPYLWRREQLRS
jgi:AraC family transcriptional regulator